MIVQYTGEIILAISILIALYIVCNSKYRIDIKINLKTLEFKTHSIKKENKQL